MHNVISPRHPLKAWIISSKSNTKEKKNITAEKEECPF